MARVGLRPRRKAERFEECGDLLERLRSLLSDNGLSQVTGEWILVAATDLLAAHVHTPS